MNETGITLSMRISKQDMTDQIAKIRRSYYAPQKETEEDLRLKHPGLKEQWDKYQVMLKLIQTSKEERK